MNSIKESKLDEKVNQLLVNCFPDRGGAYEECLAIFKEHGIASDILADLTEAHFNAMGLKTGSLVRVRNEIQKLFGGTKRKSDEPSCTICLCIPYKQIFQCSQGHLLCDSCYTKVINSNSKNCGICREPLDVAKPNRNRFAEDSVANRILPCTNDGCLESMLGSKLNDHLTNHCPKRIVKCRWTSCGETVPFSGLSTHSLICPFRRFAADSVQLQVDQAFVAKFMTMPSLVYHDLVVKLTTVESINSERYPMFKSCECRAYGYPFTFEVWIRDSTIRFSIQRDHARGNCNDHPEQAIKVLLLPRADSEVIIDMQGFDVTFLDQPCSASGIALKMPKDQAEKLLANPTSIKWKIRIIISLDFRGI